MDVVVWEAGTTSLTLWALPQVDVGPVRPILMTAVISLTPKPVDVLIVVGAAKVCLLHDDLVIAVPVAGGRGRLGSFHSRARSRRLSIVCANAPPGNGWSAPGGAGEVLEASWQRERDPVLTSRGGQVGFGDCLAQAK